MTLPAPFRSVLPSRPSLRPRTVVAARRGQAGFTLLELLAVVVILSGVAFLTLQSLGSTDDQWRFEDTRNRLAALRTAIAGDPSRTANGAPVLSGFVADVGRFPLCLTELLQASGNDCNQDTVPDTAIPVYGFQSAANIFVGWNGPYVETTTDLSGNLVYRDAWGNDGNTHNSGWNVTVTAGTSVQVVSLGLDGASGGSGTYEADFPPSGNLVVGADAFVNVRDWQVKITVTNTGGSASTARTVCARLHYPVDGALSNTTTTTQALPSLPSGDSVELTFVPSPGADLLVPIGVRSVQLLEDGASAGCVDTFDASTPERVQIVPRTTPTTLSFTRTVTS